MFATVLLAMLAVQATTQPAGGPNDYSAEALIQRVMKASGSDVWPDVKRLKFTFNVERDGELKASFSHDWDLSAGKDTVTIDGKEMVAYFPETLARVRLDEEAMKAHEQAWKRWTNDAYWLLMPLKLGDAGVKFGPVMMTRDMLPSRANVTMSFDGVGLTPGDQYDLSIDLKTDHITHWVYHPNGKPDGAGFSWDNYQDFNGLVLPTERKSDDGKTRIYFTDIHVEK